jgi:hypothetical protein
VAEEQPLPPAALELVLEADEEPEVGVAVVELSPSEGSEEAGEGELADPAGDEDAGIAVTTEKGSDPVGEEPTWTTDVLVADETEVEVEDEVDVERVVIDDAETAVDEAVDTDNVVVDEIVVVLLEDAVFVVVEPDELDDDAGPVPPARADLTAWSNRPFPT